MKTIFYTGFALVAFALNSILCRLALGTKEIDAASFTTIRLLSGVVTLIAISSFFGKKESKTKGGNWLSAFFLFGYAICFSFAYVNLTTGTGALILFTTVQATMIFVALWSGDRPRILEWIGLFFALGGLIYLVFPGLTAPPLLSSVFMFAAGVSWGFYTLRGKGSANPLKDTTGNFVRAVPMIILASLPFIFQIHLSNKGVLLAVLSGSFASGIGYSVWYAALKFHTATRAAILQLSVPALSAIGGVIFLSEAVSVRLLIATVFILGGIAMAILGRKYFKITVKI
ncbi:MAG: DMT family transporter [Acidobacteria bacterium]|nr:DMT family transporter [Acidobacteriota bacterium]MCA1639610.1 DMT family transporter [Acidobacteriota bacterium]